MTGALRIYVDKVAPLAGAWIEIHNSSNFPIFIFVAPLAGAWIEILMRVRYSDNAIVSLPSRERGLK